ncbi:MAG: ABC transporter ATP-binding protein [Tepidisphaeraceae bacterium]|jgi:ABC-2 type transport system ATP-binding protein
MSNAVASIANVGDATKAAAAIEVSGLIKSFRKRPVLTGVNWSVPAGSVVGLLGKNGAGKTTLIKCALGLLRPDAGKTLVLGQEAWPLDESAKARLGYVPQTAGLYAWMRVHQLVEYTAPFYPRWNAKLVDSLLREWELSPDQRIGSLSAGTQQKLAIILALGHEPDLLVLDEPAASLDPAARRDFLKAVLGVAAEGNRTVLFSTHITSDLERVADRVALLKGGVIAYDGALDELKDSLKRWHITATASLPDDLTVPGMLRKKVEGAQALITVRDATPAVLKEAEQRFGARIRVEDLTLEDIFLELHDERLH